METRSLISFLFAIFIGIGSAFPQGAVRVNNATGVVNDPANFVPANSGTGANQFASGTDARITGAVQSAGGTLNSGTLAGVTGVSGTMNGNFTRSGTTTGGVSSSPTILSGSVIGSGIQAASIAILGDSTIAAYMGTDGIDEFLLTPADSEAGVTITNLAVAGDTIEDQQTIWNADPDRATYDAIIVQLGLNNLDPAESAATTLGKYQDLIDDINTEKKSSAQVIVATMTPEKARLITVFGGSTGALAYQKWLDMNAAIMGSGTNAITGVDYRVSNHTAALNDGEGNLAPIYDTGDGVHENNAARAIIAYCWRYALQSSGFLASTPPGPFDYQFLQSGTSVFSKGNNLIFGGTTDSGARVTIQGRGATSATNTLRINNSSNSPLVTVRSDGFISFNAEIDSTYEIFMARHQNAGTTMVVSNTNSGISADAGYGMTTNGGSSFLYRSSTGYAAALADDTILLDNGGGDIVIYGAAEIARFKNAGGLKLVGIPTGTSGLTTGDVYSDSGTLKIMP